jgi:hypothetical protein
VADKISECLSAISNATFLFRVLVQLSVGRCVISFIF